MNNQKILVVDDEMAIRETIKDLLETIGYEVQTAGSGTEALELLPVLRPDAVICDVMMPDMGGLEVLEQVRTLPSIGSIPFLFLSAKTDADSIRQAMSLGADDYLLKPFKAIDLIQAVESKIERFAGLRAAFEAQKTTFPDHFSRFGFHEFSTPMNNLIGSLDFLLEYGEDLSKADRKEMLEAMLSSAARLRRSYTNLMLYVKIIRKEPIYSQHYGASVQEVLEIVQKRFARKKQDFRFNIHLADCRVQIRPEALELIVFELLDNALKFGNPDRISEVSGRMNAQGDAYMLEVQDYGGGMSAAQIAAIGPMVQFDRSRKEQQGWGLGLFLVKKVCEANSIGFSVGNASGGLLCKLRFPIPKRTQGTASVLDSFR